MSNGGAGSVEMEGVTSVVWDGRSSTAFVASTKYTGSVPLRYIDPQDFKVWRKHNFQSAEQREQSKPGRLRVLKVWYDMIVLGSKMIVVPGNTKSGLTLEAERGLGVRPKSSIRSSSIAKGWTGSNSGDRRVLVNNSKRSRK